MPTHPVKPLRTPVKLKFADGVELISGNYNALFHLTSEHAINSTPSKIPRKHLADAFITREEEKALEIIEEAMDA